MYKGHMGEEVLKKNERYALAFILAAAVLLRFIKLGSQSFWIDELLTAGSYASPPAGISYWQKLMWDVHGPLYSLIMHFWSMGMSAEWWLRIPSAAAGSLSVFFLFRWLRMVSTVRTALLGALFLAVSPFNVYYSQEMRFYSLLTLMLVLTLIAFSRFLEKPCAGRGVVLGMTAGAACLSHFMALFLCAGLVIYLAVTGRLKGAVLRNTALAAVIALAILSPWIYRQIYFLTRINVTDISSLPDSEKLRGGLTINRWAYPYILYAFSAGFSFGPTLRFLHDAASPGGVLAAYPIEIASVFAVFGTVSVCGIFMGRHSGFTALFLSVFLFSAVSVTAAALLNIKVFNIRYLTSVFPLFIALLAFGIPEKRRYAIPMTGALLLISLMSDWNYHMDPEYARDDLRGCVRTLMRMEKDGDLILMPGGEEMIGYYYKGKNTVESFAPAYMEQERFEQRLREKAVSFSRIWYVRARHWDVDPGDITLKILRGYGDEVEKFDFPGIKLYLFEPRASKDVTPAS